MPTITFGGLASGLDVNGIIEGLMGVERIPLQRLLNEQANLQSAKDTISSFSAKLSSLREAASALENPVKFASYRATSSDSAVATSVVGVPIPGVFDVEVTALAKEQRTFSDVQASDSSALAMSGTLSYTAGANAQIDVTIDPADSLVDIASKINTSGGRVTASVLYDGTNYRLQVRGKDTGTANAVTFGESGFSLGLSTPANTYQAAQNAAFTVDGIAMTRPTNQVAGVISGVTLALTKTTTGPVRVAVESDPTELQTKIESFVTAYNNVVSAGHLAAGWGTVKAGNAVLAGDSAVRTSLDKLARLVGNTVPGTSGLYQTLPSIGLSSADGGTIKLDSAKLTTALAADPDAVARLFVEDSSIGATGVMNDFMMAIDSLNGSSSSVVLGRMESFDTRSRRIDEDVERMETRLEAYETNLRNQFTQLELLMSSFQQQQSSLASIANSNYQ